MNSISYMKDNDKYKYQIYYPEIFINVSLPLSMYFEVNNGSKKPTKVWGAHSVNARKGKRFFCSTL